MTTEPKFIPEEAVEVALEDGSAFRVRMIDCVGYIVPSSIGYVENEAPRMVMTPWFPSEIPFNMAAEIGTRKVINEHSTIGLVVTTDGSISDIPREEYREAEERVIRELQEIHKPFVVLLNCMDPQSEQAQKVRQEMEEEYGVPVLALSCLDLGREDIVRVLTEVLYQFPVPGGLRCRCPGGFSHCPRTTGCAGAFSTASPRQQGHHPYPGRCRLCPAAL